MTIRNNMAEVQAKLNRLRIAPRKVRSVSDMIKGMDYMAARILLEHTSRKAARPIIKVLDSAAANGHNNFNFVKDNLYVKDILVDEGIKMKRYRPKGFGSAALIQKKTSHITITLDEKVKGLVRKPDEEKKPEKPVIPVTAKEEEQKVEKKQVLPEVKKETGQKGGLFGKLKRKMFRRKSI